MSIKAGNLPISTIDNTKYAMITEGEAPKRVPLGGLKSFLDSLDYCVDSGVANAYVLTPTVPIIAYVAGQIYRFKAINANTGASTLNISGVGAKSIVKSGNVALVAGDIPTGVIISAVYDGTNFQIIPDYSTQLSTKTNVIFTGDDSDPLLQTKERFVCSHANCPTNDYYIFQQFAYGSNTSIPITATSNRTLLAFGYRNVGNANKTVYFNNHFNGTWTGWQKIGNMSASSTSLFSGDTTPAVGAVITLTSNITDQNKVFITFGQGGTKTWNRVITCSDGYPGNFVLNEIITVTFTNTSFVPTSVSFQVTANNQLTVLDGSARLRNIKGMI